MKTFRSATLLISLIFASGMASANLAEQQISTTITEITAIDGLFGGCYIKLADPHDIGCPYPEFVAFDCEGVTDLSTKSMAQTKFNQANLALVTSREIFVLVQNHDINGMCYGKRVIVKQ